MLKKTLNSIDKYINRTTESGIYGWFRDKDTNIFTISNGYSAIQIEPEKVNNELQNFQSNKNSFSINQMFHEYDHNYSNVYTEDNTATYTIQELEAEVKNRKATTDKFTRNCCLYHTPYRSMGKDNSIQYNDIHVNVELLLDTIKCVDAKQVKVYYPKTIKFPIVVIGEYGRALVLPIKVA